MKAINYRLDRFLIVLSLSLIFSCSAVTGSAAAPHESGVPISPEAACPLLNGQKITPLALKKIENKSFDVSATIAKKPTVLIFYRGGW
jgi:hypothetical protein